MALDKVRIRFRKGGDLRLVSHLDLMRSFERMLRRARLPFRMTEGFHPTPRLIFAQSLPLGVVGHSEVAELELTEETDPEDVLGRLRANTFPGIEFHSARRIPVKQGARPRRAVYRVEVDDPPTDLPERIDAFLASSESWAERLRPKARQINIRPYVDSLTANRLEGIANSQNHSPTCSPFPLREGGRGVRSNAADAERFNLTPQPPSQGGKGEQVGESAPAPADGLDAIQDLLPTCSPFPPGEGGWGVRSNAEPIQLTLTLWLTQEGTARADEVARALGLTPRLIERTDLEILDEVPPEVAAATPKIEPQSRPLTKPLATDPEPEAPRETWGATANGPVVE